MRINPKDKIARIPIVKVRNSLRTAHDLLEVTHLTVSFHIPQPQAMKLISELHELLFVEPLTANFWQMTIKGRAFCMATAAAPIKREAATRLIQDLLERVAILNRNTEFAYHVGKIAVFGSYLTDTQLLNDVDIAIELSPQLKDTAKQDALRSSRIHAALDRGRRFRNIGDERYWPEQEVLLFLKAKRRGLSLHTFADMLSTRSPFTLVFGDDPQ